MNKTVWYPVYYNDIETNIEVTRCGRVRRVRVDWMKRKTAIGEIDFDKLLMTISGYKQIGIKIKGLKQKTVQVHQLVAAAFLGYKFQGHKMVVDHIDSNHLNNNLNNLKIVTQRENASKERSIKSGLPTGFYFNKQNNKYIAQIQINEKRIYLGSFNTPEEASNAYQNKLKTI